MAFGVGMIGLDHWYTAFGVLDIAAKSTRTPLIAVAEPHPISGEQRRAQIAAKYPDVAVSENPGDLLARDDIALIAICTTTKDAPELAEQALRAGKHVLSVKPPARTLAELDKVLQTAEATKRFYGAFEGMQRLHPRVQKLRELIQTGQIGTPMSYHQVGHGGLPSPWPGQPGGADSWWIHAENVPGGAWIDHAIYAVDLARFVFDGNVTATSGIIERRVHTELDVEDYGVSLMRLQPTNSAASVSLIFEDTWTAVPGSGGAHRQHFLGTEGAIQPDSENGWQVTRGSEQVQHAVPESPFFPLEALADLLQRGEEVPFGPADARANLAACLSVYDRAL